MAKIDEIKTKLTALNNGDLLMGSPYVTISFLIMFNDIKMKLLDEIINAEDMATKVAFLYCDEIKLDLKLKELNEELKQC
jgi:hypothetical protein